MYHIHAINAVWINRNKLRLSFLLYHSSEGSQNPFVRFLAFRIEYPSFVKLKKLTNIYTNVDKAKVAFEDKKYAAMLEEILKAGAIAENLYPEIKADLTKLRKQVNSKWANKSSYISYYLSTS